MKAILGSSAGNGTTASLDIRINSAWRSGTRRSGPVVGTSIEYQGMKGQRAAPLRGLNRSDTTIVGASSPRSQGQPVSMGYEKAAERPLTDSNDALSGSDATMVFLELLRRHWDIAVATILAFRPRRVKTCTPHVQRAETAISALIEGVRRLSWTRHIVKKERWALKALNHSGTREAVSHEILLGHTLRRPPTQRRRRESGHRPDAPSRVGGKFGPDNEGQVWT